MKWFLVCRCCDLHCRFVCYANLPHFLKQESVNSLPLWFLYQHIFHDFLSPFSCLSTVQDSSSIWFDHFLVFLTCMCLQSCPRAGKVILRHVMGHLRVTLIAVCSTPSSPLTALLVGLFEKFLLTVNIKILSFGCWNFTDQWLKQFVLKQYEKMLLTSVREIFIKLCLRYTFSEYDN